MDSRIEQQNTMNEIITLFTYRYSSKAQAQIVHAYKNNYTSYTGSLSELIQECHLVTRSNAKYVHERMKLICKRMGTISEKDVIAIIKLYKERTVFSPEIEYVFDRKDFKKHLSCMNTEEVKSFGILLLSKRNIDPLDILQLPEDSIEAVLLNLFAQ